MRNIFCKYFVSTIVLLVSVVYGTLTMAQGVIEEIVVTAQFRKQNLQEVPMAINAIGAAELENANINDYRNLVEYTPGLTMTNFSVSNPGLTLRGIQSSLLDLASEPAVGFYVDGVFIKRTVDQLIDLERVEILRGPQGTLYGRNTTAGVINYITKKPSDVLEGKIQLDVGDHDLVHGRGYISGPLSENIFGKVSLSVKRRDWYGDQLTNVKLKNYENDSLRGQIRFTPSDNIDLLISTDYQRDDTPGSLTAGLGIWQAPQFGGFGPGGPKVSNAVLFDPTSTDTLVNPVGKVANDIFDSMLDVPQENDRDEWGISLNAQIEVADLKVTSITAFRNTDIHDITDVDGTPCVLTPANFLGEVFRNLGGASLLPPVGCYAIGDPALMAIGLTASQWKGRKNENTDQITQEIRISSLGQESPFSFGGNLDWMLGFFYYNEDGTQTRDSDLSGVPQATADNQKLETEAWAIFGQGIWHATDNINLTLGFRYTEEDKDYGIDTVSRPHTTTLPPFLPGPLGGAQLIAFDFRPALPFANMPGTFINVPGVGFVPMPTDPQCAIGTRCLTPQTAKTSFNSFDPKVTLDYTFPNNWLVFASYSTGFKSGGFNGTPVDLVSATVPFAEEQITAYEAGLKGVLFDGRMIFAINGFYYDYEQEQILGNFDHDNNPLTPNALVTRNALGSTKAGAEVEVNTQVTDRIQLRLGYAFLDATYDDFPVFSGTVEINNFGGNRAIRAPKHSGNISASYTYPTEAMGNLTFRIDGTVVSKQFFVPENFDINSQDAYSTWNASVVWEPNDRWRATFWMHNIFDEEYLTQRIQAGAPAITVGAFPGTSLDISRERSTVGTPQAFGFNVSYRFGE